MPEQTRRETGGKCSDLRKRIEEEQYQNVWEMCGNETKDVWINRHESANYTQGAATANFTDGTYSVIINEHEKKLF